MRLLYKDEWIIFYFRTSTNDAEISMKQKYSLRQIDISYKVLKLWNDHTIFVVLAHWYIIKKYKKWFYDVIICHPQIYQKNMYHRVSYGNLLRTLFFYSNLNGVQLQYTLPFLLFWTQWWNFLLQRRKSDMHTMFLICENFRRRRRKIFTFSIYGK